MDTIIIAMALLILSIGISTLIIWFNLISIKQIMKEILSELRHLSYKNSSKE